MTDKISYILFLRDVLIKRKISERYFVEKKARELFCFKKGRAKDISLTGLFKILMIYSLA
jgi:hypothetical protein